MNKIVERGDLTCFLPLIDSQKRQQQQKNHKNIQISGVGFVYFILFVTFKRNFNNQFQTNLMFQIHS